MKFLPAPAGGGLRDKQHKAEAVSRRPHTSTVLARQHPLCTDVPFFRSDVKVAHCAVQPVK